MDVVTPPPQPDPVVSAGKGLKTAAWSILTIGLVAAGDAVAAAFLDPATVTAFAGPLLKDHPAFAMALIAAGPAIATAVSNWRKQKKKVNGR